MQSNGEKLIEKEKNQFNKYSESKTKEKNIINQPSFLKSSSADENKNNIQTPLQSSKSSDSKNPYSDLNNLNNLLSEFAKDFYEKFELIELLKSGSAGAVYRGKLRDKINSRPIAFKFLFSNIKEKKNKLVKEKSDSNAKENINHSEIKIHGVLKNIHIPEIYGYYKIHNSSCIAMEFDKYGDIENFKRKILKRSSLSESLVLYIAGGILEALFYIHSKYKIIHMDIKQQNVLIDDFLMIKLTDFSVSVNYRTQKNYIDLPMVGTCYYMSPEVLNKKRILVSEASKIDIYSLGVLLYLLAFYDYPYKLNDIDSKDYTGIANNIANNNLEFPEETGHSKLFLKFLEKCLNKDIKKRYDIYQAMNDPWVKGYQIILNEKEKTYNAGKFIIDLMVDNLMNFNNYIRKQESFL
jgi:serine/threonine protein kinase